MQTSRDQVLAARMLRLANSAYCAPLQEITTISEAVVRLGAASVRNVVLATCMASRLQSGSAYGTHGRGLAAHGIGKLLVLQLSKDYVRGGGEAPADEDVRQAIGRGLGVLTWPTASATGTASGATQPRTPRSSRTRWPCAWARQMRG